MDIVPVIDLKGGQVVHARAGDRRSYMPIRTQLVSNAAPLSVVTGLMNLHPFRRLYVADLDAIAQAGDHAADIERASAAFPNLELWVDNGLSDPAACQSWIQSHRHRLVLGSECQFDPELPTALLDRFGPDRLALSLDFRGTRFLGPTTLLTNSDRWPQTTIAMTLSRVGQQIGPDVDFLRSLKQQAPAKSIYGAGGVRGTADLHALRGAGAEGVLVASALHDGRIGTDDLRAFSSA